jgi:hypothetical protein
MFPKRLKTTLWWFQRFYDASGNQSVSARDLRIGSPTGEMEMVPVGRGSEQKARRRAESALSALEARYEIREKVGR